MPRVIPTKVLDPSSDGIPATAIEDSLLNEPIAVPSLSGIKLDPPSSSTAAAVVTPTGTPTKEDPAEDEGSNGSDQPWDVQRSMSEDASSAGGTPTRSSSANKTTPRYPATTSASASGLKKREYQEHPPTNNKASSSGTMLSSGRRTTRPLSPPSQNGMQDEGVYTNDTVEEDETRDAVDLEDLDDMPMDEQQEYKRQRDLLCGVVVDDDGTGAENICDYTLKAIGDMCGDGTPSESPARKPYVTNQARTRRQETLNRARALKASKAKVPPMKAPYGVEEQTAIEVEYVEPVRKAGAVGKSATTSPKKKNMLVQAMARRAKQDFEKEKGKPATAASAAKNIQVAPETNQDNVYANFSSSEKRKFLKLINTGLTPAEATEQVLKDRSQTSEAFKETETPGADTKAKGNRLAFWKRGSQTKGEDPAGEVSRNAPPLVSAPPVGEEAQFAKSGINYYDAVRKERGDESFLAEDEYVQDSQGDKKKKNRTSKTGSKYGFSKLGGTPAFEDDSSEQPVVESRQALPALPPQPINTARSQPAGEDGGDAGSNEGVFKPTVAATLGASAMAGAAMAAAANSEVPEYDDDDLDSLLQDDDDDLLLSKKAHPFKDRSIAAPESSTSHGEEKQDIDRDLQDEQMAAAMLNVTSRSTAGRDMSLDDMDLDVETTYMNSTEIMSHYGGGLNTSMDARSVVSGKSYKTSMTMATNYTVSTRSRRPGAAKQRLTSQKTGESTSSSQHGRKVQGWQESIQAAAAGMNRVWDPVRGWVDYENPEVPEGNDVDISDEKIVINVDNLRKAASADEGDDGPPPTISSGDAVDAQAVMDAFSPPPPPPPREKAPGTSRSLPGTAGDQDGSPSRSRGWVQSMKEATARINTQGKKWDPERGWISLEDNETHELHQDDYRYSGAVDTQAESDTQDFGTVPQDTLMPLPDRSKHAQDPNGQGPMHKTRRDPSGQIHVPVEEDHQSVDASTKSGGGRYIQLGESGSVSSYYYGKLSTQNPGNGTRAQPAVAMSESQNGQQNQRSSVIVDVKRERMNSEDAEFFPDLAKERRRGTGPVDVDEIDDLQDLENFVAAPDFSWDEDTSNVDAPAGGKKAVPKLRMNMRDTEPVSGQIQGRSGRSVVSSGSVSTSSKSIPKLRGPKRDTSPIRGRDSTSNNIAHTPPQKEVIEPSGTRGVVSPLGASPQDLPTRAGPSPPGSGPDRTLKNPTKSPGAMNDTRSTYTAESSPSTGSVRNLSDYWERRSQSDVGLPQSAEWKSFLAKKVRAEAEAAGNQRSRPRKDDEKDSLFDFNDSEGAFPTARPRANRDAQVEGLRSLEEISDISPIQQVHEDDDGSENGAPSEASTGFVQGNTFMQRLQACAAPMMPRTSASGNSDGKSFQEANCNPGIPLAHLAFMRTNPAATGSSPEKNSRSSASRFVPPSFCGKPDIIVEEDENDLALGEEDSKKKQKTLASLSPSEKRSLDLPRSRSASRGGRQGDMSSVISDEMTGGNKTAYLEAIAMKAAVSGSKKRRSRSTTGSDVSASTGTSNNKHSESWQKFLDKKKKNSSTPPSAEITEQDVSKAAEKYASEKVDQMMSMMAARAQEDSFQARPAEEATGAFPSVSNVAHRYQQTYKSEASRAAEELAAARVEAMMASLSSPARSPRTQRAEELNEGEVEI